jgi:hypothetical protein
MQIEGMDATNALISFSQASMQPSVDPIQETTNSDEQLFR